MLIAWIAMVFINKKQEERAQVLVLFHGYHDSGALAKSGISFRVDSTFEFYNGFSGMHYGRYSCGSNGVIRLFRGFEDRALHSNYLKIVNKGSYDLIVEADSSGNEVKDGCWFVYKK